MRKRHMTEEEIQQYAIDEAGSTPEVMGHLSSCGICKERVRTYQLLFSEMEKEPDLSFGFSIAELVLPQLEAPKSRFSWAAFLVYAFMGIGVVVVGIAIFALRSLFSGFTAMGVYLLIVTSLSVLIYQAAGYYKKYREQINILNNEAT